MLIKIQKFYMFLTKFIYIPYVRMLWKITEHQQLKSPEVLAALIFGKLTGGKKREKVIIIKIIILKQCLNTKKI